jgi:hypothetical protein
MIYLDLDSWPERIKEREERGGMKRRRGDEVKRGSSLQGGRRDESIEREERIATRFPACICR